ncbi:MAG TPA: hypothetical protein VMQ81_10105 [Acidimicrobiia bacterium]|nr:hypothetical protein [Acidimicrobiia bacterium]
MRRVRTLATTGLLTLGLATAAFAGVAAAGELSKKEYKAEANQICEDAGDEIDAIFETAFEGVESEEDIDPAAFEAAINEAIPVFREAIDDIGGLEGPSALERKVDKLLDQYSEVVDEIEDDPQGAFESDEDPFEAADKRARKLGLRRCAQG